jgi:hypothetical protein
MGVAAGVAAKAWGAGVSADFWPQAVRENAIKAANRDERFIYFPYTFELEPHNNH